MPLSEQYRFLPRFKGKKRLGNILFKKSLFSNKDVVIKCQGGLQYHILNTHDSVGRDLFFDGVYEPETIKTISALLKDGDIMIDAGANIGAISLPIAKNRNVRIYAFEPAKKIHDTLLQNIAINNVKNIKALPLALSDKEGEVDFYESDRVHGWSGMVKIDSFQKYQVKTTTLDQFAEQNNLDKVAVLKMDVQGWEYFVLKGAEKMIREKRIAHILFEFEWWAEKNADLELGAAQQFLLDQGYELQTLDGRKIDEPLTEGSLILHARSGRHRRSDRR